MQAPEVEELLKPMSEYFCIPYMRKADEFTKKPGNCRREESSNATGRVGSTMWQLPLLLHSKIRAFIEFSRSEGMNGFRIVWVEILLT